MIRREPSTTARWGAVLVVAALAATAYCREAEGATNLPPVCSNASAVGASIGSCSSSSQTFRPAEPTSLVRACDTAGCAASARTWRVFSQVTSGQFVEVCTADKSPGAPLTECRGTSTTTWGAMAMVPKADVVTLDTPSGFTLTFTAETVSGVESVTPRLTWSTQPAGATCTAAGHPSWTGAKPAAGSEELAPISSTATFTMECSWPESEGTATIDWTPPTQNTDGTPFTNPAGVRIHYGQAADQLVQTVDVNSPSPPLNSYTVEGLTPGVWYFSIRVINTQGADSAPSNVGSKTVGGGAAVQRTVGIVVNPRPGPATITNVR